MAKNKILILIGLVIWLFLVISYFIPIEAESGANYIVEDSLLGIIIVHNIWLLISYILIGLFFICLGIYFKSKNKIHKN